ncbi:Major facilitator superfamily protein [Perilla frutescens var. hirtella]|uniref:Major facilitator superfamily protein n=1 Tax=Perilla frutescens var. hirtella TaxID=608512 RepID=A0AAD4PFR9_PERFH|nr:Major facilitator superfamily protein [Perilla frutescens var. hirtella]
MNMDSKGYTQDGTVDLRGQPVLADKTGKWKACAFLVGYEAFERMAFYGIASNLVGMVLLTMAVSIKFLKPSCENGVCNKATTTQIAFFYTSLYIIAIGAGGTKPNISTFGADQFDDLNPHEKKLKASFFNWWMFSAFTGALFATLGLVYIQENLGWGLGYGIPTVGLILSLIIFYIGTPMYRHKVRRTRHPAGDLLRVVVTAFANANLKLPTHPSELHELDQQYYITTRKRRVHHTPVFRFLDMAAIKKESSTRPACTVTQVEGAKLVLGMAMIWAVTLIPSTIWAQINTLFVKQGTTLDRHFGSDFQIPAASLGSFVTLSMLVSVPMYDRYFVPFMQRKTGNPRGITLLQRLGIGFVIQILAIAIAYAVEVKRMGVIKAHGITGPDEVVPMSIFHLLPQYVLLGVADVFNAIGLLEFFYDQSPEEMQSLGTTFFTSGIGVGNFLNSFLVTVVDKVTGRGGGKSWIGKNVNESHLDYYYGFIFLLSALNLVAFLLASKKYVYKVESAEVVEGCEQIEGKALGLQV